MEKQMKSLLRILTCMLVAGSISELGARQMPAPQLPALRVPRVSQGARVTQVIGLSEVTIQYHRPGVKGRDIWHTIQPYDSIWRAGANEPTLMTFSDPVKVEGKQLAAGTYRFLTIPDKAEWTLIFNTEIKNWGTVYEPMYDTLKVKVKPEEGPHEEWMSFNFTDLTSNSAKVVLAWDNVRVGFKVEFNTLAKMQNSVGTWQLLNQSARYALGEKVYLNEAMGWIDRSIGMDRNATNLRTKAELLAAIGKSQDAIAVAEEAIKAGKERDPKFDSKGIEELIGNWKKGMK